ncbi:MAG: hypothetical protein FKY71_13285 [Spiribacter salinus]|uniref:Uncharacterized protein n=1 Tax=Spiribacter salinus TaxID=1335746 RepID=A0A540VP48_9GAMM|nr:MAG: hypothetical protein FKY71_13285 [Spiribacter salinus]
MSLNHPAAAGLPVRCMQTGRKPGRPRFSPWRVVESRATGADALLLIVSVLDDGHLVQLAGLGKEGGWLCWWKCMMRRRWSVHSRCPGA